MKQSMSSFDLYAEVQELQSIIGSRLNKVFQVGRDELKLVFNVRGEGKRDMTIESGKRIHLTTYPKPSPKKPSQFAMALRKSLGNSILREVAQVDFDRIVMLTFSKGKEDYILVAELFGNGNVLLLNSNHGILAVMKPRRYSTREVVTKARYELPPGKKDPFRLSGEEVREMVNSGKKDLVRVLAARLGLGGVYAEEVCLRAGIEKHREDISLQEGERIVEEMGRLRERAGYRPRVVFEESRAVDVTPLELERYRDREVEVFSSMDQALDAYFTKYELDRLEAIKEEKFQKELERVRKRLKRQSSILKKYIRNERAYREIGDLIYQHYQAIEELLNTLHKARKKYSWEEIEERIREVKEVKKLLPSQGKVIVELSGREVGLSLSKSVFENAEYYYSRSKKAKDKTGGALKAVRQSSEEVKKLKSRGKEAFRVESPRPEKRVKKKGEWYEKFRWFFSSDGFLVIGGKDATSNEVVYKKHLGKEDIFIHADIHGAPAVAIKSQGKDVPRSTIQEAFDFAASYSRAWKYGLASLEVYWVEPQQVSKQPESGEFIAKGSFVIRGKRNYGVGKVELAIGIITDGEVRVIGGPENAVASRAECYVVMVPGREKSMNLARKIKEMLVKKCGREVKSLNPDEIQKMLPPGTGTIKGD